MAVEDNVAFDTAGACFVSKGTRTEGISWRGNLGAKTWRVATEVSSPTSSTFSTRMQSPITFLIAADNCTCEQNVAAGSQGKGFEVVLDHQGAQNFIFNGNMAHSNKVVCSLVGFLSPNSCRLNPFLLFIAAGRACPFR